MRLATTKLCRDMAGEGFVTLGTSLAMCRPWACQPGTPGSPASALKSLFHVLDSGQAAERDNAAPSVTVVLSSRG